MFAAPKKSNRDQLAEHLASQEKFVGLEKKSKFAREDTIREFRGDRDGGAGNGYRNNRDGNRNNRGGNRNNRSGGNRNFRSGGNRNRNGGGGNRDRGNRNGGYNNRNYDDRKNEDRPPPQSTRNVVGPSLGPNLPPLKVCYTFEQETVAKWLKEHVLMGEEEGGKPYSDSNLYPPLGLDTETKPSFSKAQTARCKGPDVLQIGVPDGNCLVIHMCKMERLDSEGMQKILNPSGSLDTNVAEVLDLMSQDPSVPADVDARTIGYQLLSRVLRSEEIPVVGVAIEDDCLEMLEKLNFETKCILELGTIAKDNEKVPKSLKGVSEYYVPGFVMPKIKALQMSNWADYLGDAQIEYASADAFAGAIVVSTLEASSEYPQHTQTSLVKMVMKKEGNLSDLRNLRQVNKRKRQQEKSRKKNGGAAPALVAEGGNGNITKSKVVAAAEGGNSNLSQSTTNAKTLKNKKKNERKKASKLKKKATQEGDANTTGEHQGSPTKQNPFPQVSKSNGLKKTKAIKAGGYVDMIDETSPIKQIPVPQVSDNNGQNSNGLKNTKKRKVEGHDNEIHQSSPAIQICAPQVSNSNESDGNQPKKRKANQESGGEGTVVTNNKNSVVNNVALLDPEAHKKKLLIKEKEWRERNEHNRQIKDESHEDMATYIAGKRKLQLIVDEIQKLDDEM